MTRAIMNGCNGKMGQCITGICAQDPDIEIVAGIDTYDGIKNDYPVFKSLADCDVEADVIIDFSNAKAVDALIRSVNILVPGVSVELNTREKALVLIENEKDILRPTLLMFRDNSILDLALERNASLYIVDIMKTMDNRYIMDRETVNKILNQRKEESNAHN